MSDYYKDNTYYQYSLLHNQDNLVNNQANDCLNQVNNEENNTQQFVLKVNNKYISKDKLCYYSYTPFQERAQKFVKIKINNEENNNFYLFDGKRNLHYKNGNDIILKENNGDLQVFENNQYKNLVSIEQYDKCYFHASKSPFDQVKIVNPCQENDQIIYKYLINFLIKHEDYTDYTGVESYIEKEIKRHEMLRNQPNYYGQYGMPINELREEEERHNKNVPELPPKDLQFESKIRKQRSLTPKIHNFHFTKKMDWLHKFFYINNQCDNSFMKSEYCEIWSLDTTYGHNMTFEIHSLKHNIFEQDVYKHTSLFGEELEIIVRFATL